MNEPFTYKELFDELDGFIENIPDEKVKFPVNENDEIVRFVERLGQRNPDFFIITKKQLVDGKFTFEQCLKLLYVYATMNKYKIEGGIEL